MCPFMGVEGVDTRMSTRLLEALWPLLRFKDHGGIPGHGDTPEGRVCMAVGDMPLIQDEHAELIDLTRWGPLGYPSHKVGEPQYLMPLLQFNRLLVSDDPHHRRVVDGSRFRLAPEETVLISILRRLSHVSPDKRDEAMALLAGYDQVVEHPAVWHVLRTNVRYDAVSSGLLWT